LLNELGISVVYLENGRMTALYYLHLTGLFELLSSVCLLNNSIKLETNGLLYISKLLQVVAIYYQTPVHYRYNYHDTSFYSNRNCQIRRQSKFPHYSQNYSTSNLDSDSRHHKKKKKKKFFRAPTIIQSTTRSPGKCL
jgi:hypothetical protein